MNATLVFPGLKIHDAELLEDSGSILALGGHASHWPDGLLRRKMAEASVFHRIVEGM